MAMEQECAVAFGSRFVHMRDAVVPDAMEASDRASMRALRVQGDDVNYDNVQQHHVYGRQGVYRDQKDDVVLDTNFAVVRPAQLIQDQAYHKAYKDQFFTCQGCKAYASGTSEFKKPKWQCEFCGKENHVKKTKALKKMAGASLVEYTLQAPTSKQPQECPLYIFCIDTSGSMGVTSVVRNGGEEYHVSRLDHMKAAIKGCIADLLSSKSNARVALVAFHTNLAVYTGSKLEADLVLDECQLYDEDLIKQAAQRLMSIQPLWKVHETLLASLNQLYASGQTALGPALVFARGLSSRWCQVIVCTDGLSNIGIGAMHEPALAAHSKDVLNALALDCVEEGIVVSVVSIVGEECQLQDIGRLADVTGGDVARVEAHRLEDTLLQLVHQEYLASSVSVTLLMHSCLQAYRFGRPVMTDLGFSFETQQLGCVTSDVFTSFQFGAILPSQAAQLPVPCMPPAPAQSIPFQVQVEYTTRHGARVLRVLTTQRPQTSERGEAFRGADVNLLCMHAARSTGTLMQESLSAANHMRTGYDILASDIQKVQQHTESIYENVQLTLADIYDNPCVLQENPSDETADKIFKLKRMGKTQREREHQLRSRAVNNPMLMDSSPLYDIAENRADSEDAPSSARHHRR